MKRLLSMACLTAAAVVALVFSTTARTAPAEEAAIKLFKSLTPEQKKLALKSFDDKERCKEVFPPVKRPGLPLKELSDEQKKLVNAAIRAVTSEYGAERVLRLAKQSGAARRYINFFGDPIKGKSFAWRLAQHHLTLIYAEFATGKPQEFGPILLGGNPVKDLWDEEDQLFLKLYASLSKDELAKAKSKGKTGGIQIAKLSKTAQKLASQLFAKRAEVFNPNYRKNLTLQVEADGGIPSFFLRIKGDASKSFHEGNRYRWSIAGDRVYCDWNTLGKKHIHMTLRAKPQKG